jgi:hypothetical protein
MNNKRLKKICLDKPNQGLAIKQKFSRKKTEKKTKAAIA